ncbi:MAG: aldo/keto reductase [Actinomycetota bacterium]
MGVSRPTFAERLGALGPPIIGLGTAALGRPAYITSGHDVDLGTDRSVDGLERNAHAVFDRAYESGIRYFDTARSYGFGERFVARWLDDRGHDDCVVASKWGYRYVGDWRLDAEVHEVKDHSLDAFRRQLVETRELLGDRLDLYQVHSVTPTSPVLGDGPLIDALHELRDGGVAIGISTSGPHQADVIDTALASPLPLDAVQVTWNPLEPSAGPALQRAADAGVAVIVKEAMANGRLLDEGADDVAVLSAALRQPFTDVVLSGAANVEQVTSNLRAPDTQPMRAEPVEPERYWRERSERAWR